MKKLVLVIVVLAGVMAPTHADAKTKPPSPECGATITSDITLTQDMTCTGGYALRVTAPGVTVDLGHHKITVDGTVACPEYFGTPTGGCAISVLTFPSGGHIFGDLVSGVTIKNGSLRGGGIYGKASVDRVIFENATTTPFDATITRSQFTDSQVFMFAGSTLDDNEFIRSPIRLDDAFLFIGQVAITNNRIEDSPTAGIQMQLIFIDVLTGEVSGNQIRNNAGPGLSLLFDTSSVTAFAVSNNKVMNNGGDGLSIHGFSAYPVSGGQVTLSGNVAMRNAGVGIRVQDDAPPLIIDGGGNVARNNDNGVQCVGIVCR